MKRELSPETAASPYVAELRTKFWAIEELMRGHMRLELEATRGALDQLEAALEMAESSIRLGLASPWPVGVVEEEVVVEAPAAAPVVVKVSAKGKKK